MSAFRRPLLTDASTSRQTRSRIRDGELVLAWRRRSEIEAAAAELRNFVWYYRKIVMYSHIEAGVEARLDPDIHDAVQKAMQRLEEDYGRENLPQVLSDFEWGFLQGKFSALNWVMGEVWDELST